MSLSEYVDEVGESLSKLKDSLIDSLDNNPDSFVDTIMSLIVNGNETVLDFIDITISPGIILKECFMRKPEEFHHAYRRYNSGKDILSKHYILKSCFDNLQIGGCSKLDKYRFLCKLYTHECIPFVNYDFADILSDLLDDYIIDPSVLGCLIPYFISITKYELRYLEDKYDLINFQDICQSEFIIIRKLFNVMFKISNRKINNYVKEVAEESPYKLLHICSISHNFRNLAINKFSELEMYNFVAAIALPDKASIFTNKYDDSSEY